MNTFQHIAMTLSLLLTASASAELKPIFLQPDQILFETDFDSIDLSDTDAWKIVQNTRWETRSGLLVGSTATLAYQDSRTDHNGNRPYIRKSLPAENFIAEWRVKWVTEKQNLAAEFGNAFGVHVTKVCFTSKEATYLTGGKFEVKVKVPSKDHRVESDRWYHIMAEFKGDEMVVQIEDGPTFYMKHSAVASSKEVMQFQGPIQGTVYVDYIRFWGIKDAPAPGWANRKKKIEFAKSIVIGKPQKKTQ